MPHQVATSADWQNAAQLIADTSTADSLHDMGEVIIRGAHGLFQAELVILDQFDENAQQLAYQMYPPVTESIARLQPAFMALWHEHPYMADWVSVIGGGRVRFLSDRVAAREFRRTGLWNEVYIYLRGRNQLMLGGRIEPDRYWCLSLNRLGSDFGPRDREIARFLQPHIARLLQRQARRDRANRSVAALDHAKAAYLIVGVDGEVLEISDHANALLTRSGVDARSRIAALVARRPQTGVHSQPLENLQAVLLRPALAAPAFVMLGPPAGPLGAGANRLTQREADILLWLGEGKTNSDIAVILGVSPRTVEKHCERLFAKLGVENRLAAALLARR